MEVRKMRKIKLRKERKGQIWIESVLYTLIGLTLIGITLSFVMPRINAAKDNSIVEQSIQSLSVFEGKIDSVIENGQGNARNADLTLKKGYLLVADADSDSLSIVLEDFGEPYSEPGVPIKIGRLEVLTEEDQGDYKATVRLPYNDVVDIVFENGESEKRYNSASIPHRFSFVNQGINPSSGKYEIKVVELN